MLISHRLLLIQIEAKLDIRNFDQHYEILQTTFSSINNELLSSYLSWEFSVFRCINTVSKLFYPPSSNKVYLFIEFLPISTVGVKKFVPFI